jgi:coproporphyrinogen III oxidase
VPRSRREKLRTFDIPRREMVHGEVTRNGTQSKQWFAGGCNVTPHSSTRIL